MPNMLECLPMPHYEGVEPSEIEIERIRKFIEEGRFDELNDDLQDWVVGRLMPSLVRYGVYPPPAEPSGLDLKINV